MRTVVCDTQAVVDLRRAFVPTVVCDFVDLRRANRVGNTDEIDVEDDFGDGNSCVFIRKIITPLT